MILKIAAIKRKNLVIQRIKAETWLITISAAILLKYSVCDDVHVMMLWQNAIILLQNLSIYFRGFNTRWCHVI